MPWWYFHKIGGPLEGTRLETVDPGDYVVFTVKDTGRGISPEHMDRIFEPFYSTKGTQGMGIGAYQAREFARATGGSLHVESAIGEGTRVVLKLPLVNKSESRGLLDNNR